LLVELLVQVALMLEVNALWCLCSLLLQFFVGYPMARNKCWRRGKNAGMIIITVLAHVLTMLERASAKGNYFCMSITLAIHA